MTNATWILYEMNMANTLAFVWTRVGFSSDLIKHLRPGGLFHMARERNTLPGTKSTLRQRYDMTHRDVGQEAIRLLAMTSPIFN